MLNKFIIDFECRLVGSGCGKNMVLEIVSKVNGYCIDKCVCADNFVENDVECIQCDWEEDDNDNNDNYNSTVNLSFLILN